MIEMVKWRIEVTTEPLTQFHCHIILVLSLVVDYDLPSSHTTYKRAQYPWKKQGKLPNRNPLVLVSYFLLLFSQLWIEGEKK